MNTLVLNKKKYILVEEKEYAGLVQRAVAKIPSARKLTLKEGKNAAYALIDKWHKEK